MPRGAIFSRVELENFLDIVENVLPLSAIQWETPTKGAPWIASRGCSRSYT
jgi:hypothetical protein